MLDESRILDVLDNLDSNSTPEDACGTGWELLRKVRAMRDKMLRVQYQIDALFPDDTPTQRGCGASGNSAGELPQIDGYDVECVLGRGGMGVVYKAKDRRLDRCVWRSYGVSLQAASGDFDSQSASSSELARDGCRR